MTVHPLVVHFPVALVCVAFVLDLASRGREATILHASARVCWLVAAIGAVLAVASGFFDLGRVSPGDAAPYLKVHIRAGLLLTVLIVLVCLARWVHFLSSHRRFGLVYGIAGIIVVGLTAFQAWYGGEMVYAGGVGVAAAGKGTETPEQARKRIDAVAKALGAEDVPAPAFSEHQPPVQR